MLGLTASLVFLELRVEWERQSRRNRLIVGSLITIAPDATEENEVSIGYYGHGANDPITLQLQTTIYYARRLCGLGIGKAWWGWLVSAPRCLGFSWVEPKAGSGSTAADWNHLKATRSQVRHLGRDRWPEHLHVASPHGLPVEKAP